jgi:triacylglycerol lipase
MNSLNRCLTVLIFFFVIFGCSAPFVPKGESAQADARSAIMGAKPIPEINWQNIRPPFDWWDFFKDAERHPFRFQANGFDMRNAWWLIEASTLVYSNPEFVQKTFVRAGLPTVRFFDGQSTQCFVASNNDFIIVTFRGTETRVRSERPDYLDVVYDLLIVVRIWLVPSESGGSVHGGFNQALDEVWWDRKQEGRQVAGLKSYLDELSAQKERPVWFTGHSLGAALATLAADRYGKSRGLYTFGSPRVGDIEFRTRFKTTYYRFVNDDDIVTRVPPEVLGYRHVGNRIFIDGNGYIGSLTSPMNNGKDSLADPDVDVFKSVEQAKQAPAASIPSWLLHHVPVLYSTRIWNSYILAE